MPDIDCPRCGEPAERNSARTATHGLPYLCSRCSWSGDESALDRQHRLVKERRESVLRQLRQYNQRCFEGTVIRSALEEQVFWLDSLDVIFTELRRR